MNYTVWFYNMKLPIMPGMTFQKKTKLFAGNRDNLRSTFIKIHWGRWCSMNHHLYHTPASTIHYKESKDHQGLNWSIYSYITSLIASGLLIRYIYSKLLLVYKKNGRNNSSQAANSLETIGFCQSSPRELLNGQFRVARRRHYQIPLLTFSL